MENRFSLGLEYLRTLQALRDHGTLAEAAAARHISGPSASAQLANLSKWVGAPLVTRKGRGIRLTQQALFLLEHGDVVLAELERAQADVAKFNAGELGTVTVGSFATALQHLVVPSLSILSRDRPGLSVSAVEMEATEGLNALDNFDIDLFVSFDHSQKNGVRNSRYEYIDLLSDPVRVVVSVEHPLAKMKSIDLSDLADEQWIVGTGASSYSSVALHHLTAASIAPKVAHRCDDWQTMLSLVACGSGVALVPRLALGRMRKDVVVLLVEPPLPENKIFVAIRKGSGDAPRVSAMTGALLDVARKAR